MIKDIGIQGLKVIDVAPPNHIYDAFNSGAVMVLPERISLDMIDVTTMNDTERVYMQCYEQNTGPR